MPSRSARCKSVQKATGTDRLETAGAAGAQCGVGARAALLFALLPPTCGTAWLFPIPSLSPPSVVRPGFLPNVKLAFSAGKQRGRGEGRERQRAGAMTEWSSKTRAVPGAVQGSAGA